jgi:hypothetical protein
MQAYFRNPIHEKSNRIIPSSTSLSARRDGTGGVVTTAITKIEAGKIPALSPNQLEKLPTEKLVEVAVGTFTRLQDAMPYIVELRKRFKDAPRGNANIANCKTWEQFCERNLHRTASTLRKALQAEKEVPTGVFLGIEVGDTIVSNKTFQYVVSKIDDALIHTTDGAKPSLKFNRTDGKCPTGSDNRIKKILLKPNEPQHSLITPADAVPQITALIDSFACKMTRADRDIVYESLKAYLKERTTA